MLIGIIIGVAAGFVLGFLLGAGLSVVLMEDEFTPTAPVMYGYGGSDAGAAWRMRTGTDAGSCGDSDSWTPGGPSGLSGDAGTRSVPERPGDADPFRLQHASPQERDPVERFRLAMLEELETDENGDWIDDEELRIWERRIRR